jgi:hypothetical protein
VSKNIFTPLKQLKALIYQHYIERGRNMSFQPPSERRKKNSVNPKEIIEKVEKEHEKKIEEIMESWKKAVEKIKNEGNE